MRCFVFLAALAIIFLAVLLLSLREFLKYRRFTWFSQNLQIKSVAQKVALGEWEHAEKEIHLLLQKSGHKKEVLLLYTQMLRETGRSIEALEFLKETARKFPEELLFRLEEARNHLKLDNPQAALAAYKVCAPLLHNESDFLDFGRACFLSGFVDYCWEVIERFLPSTRLAALLALGADCQIEKKHYHEAIALYHKAVDLGLNNHEILCRLAHAYRKHGNLGMAEKLFRKILHHDSGDNAATIGLGECYQERGLYQRALWVYQSGQAWEKNDKILLSQAAFCALVTKNYDVAIHCLESLIQQKDTNSQTLLYYAHALEKQNRWFEAEQQYLNFIQAFPQDSRGYRALAWLYGVGLSTRLTAEQGLQFANQALQLSPDMIAWDILSACEARRGNFEQAHQIQERLAPLDKDQASRARRQQMMRLLRKQIPIGGHQLVHTLVA